MTARLCTAVLVSLATIAAHAAPGVLASGERRVQLVELYTSEGCSSCPPADEWMRGRLDDARLWSEIVPVAFHVDYWDYIGWPDRFASPVFSRRQRQHAQLERVRNVYTPGFVVGGKEWKGFFRGTSLPRGAGEVVGDLRLDVDGDRVSVRFTPPHDLGRLELHVARLGFGLYTEVRGGENSGRRLEHDFVVLGYTRADMEHGARGYATTLQLEPVSVESTRHALAAWVTPVDDTLPIQAVGGFVGSP